MPEITLQNISTLISKTWDTGLTAFLLKHKHRYWFAACMNVVASFEEDE